MIKKTFSNISSNALPEKIPVLGKGPKGEMVGNLRNKRKIDKRRHLHNF